MGLCLMKVSASERVLVEAKVFQDKKQHSKQLTMLARSGVSVDRVPPLED